MENKDYNIQLAKSVENRIADKTKDNIKLCDICEEIKISKLCKKMKNIYHSNIDKDIKVRKINNIYDKICKKFKKSKYYKNYCNNIDENEFTDDEIEQLTSYQHSNEYWWS